MGDSLSREAARQHDAVCTGLLVTILSEPENSTKLLSFLGYTATDGMACVIRDLSWLVAERWSRLKEVSQQQLVWLVRELVQLGIVGVDEVVWNLLRHSASCSTKRNLWLSEQLVRLVEEQRQWLLSHPQLLAGVVYCLVRLVEDHFKAVVRIDPRL